MVQSRAGSLCMSCGHIEKSSQAVTPSIALGKDGLDQMLEASKDASEDAPVTPPAEPAHQDEPKPSPAPVADEAKDVSNAPATNAPAALPSQDMAPVSPWQASKVDDPPAEGATDDASNHTEDPEAPSLADLDAVEHAVESVEKSIHADAPATEPEKTNPSSPSVSDDAGKDDAEQELKTDDAPSPVNESPRSSESDKSPVAEPTGSNKSLEPVKPLSAAPAKPQHEPVDVPVAEPAKPSEPEKSAEPSGSLAAEQSKPHPAAAETSFVESPKPHADEPKPDHVATVGKDEPDAEKPAADAIVESDNQKDGDQPGHQAVPHTKVKVVAQDMHAPVMAKAFVDDAAPAAKVEADEEASKNGEQADDEESPDEPARPIIKHRKSLKIQAKAVAESVTKGAVNDAAASDDKDKGDAKVEAPQADDKERPDHEEAKEPVQDSSAETAEPNESADNDASDTLEPVVKETEDTTVPAKVDQKPEPNVNEAPDQDDDKPASDEGTTVVQAEIVTSAPAAEKNQAAETAASEADASTPAEASEDDTHDEPDIKDAEPDVNTDDSPPKPQVEEVDPEDTPTETLEQAEHGIAEGESKSADSERPSPDTDASDDARLTSVADEKAAAATQVESPGAIPFSAPATTAAKAEPVLGTPASAAPVAAPAQAPTAPGPPAGSAAPKQLAPVAPVTHPTPWNHRKTLAVVAALVVILVVGFFAYMSFMSPGGALASFGQRVATAGQLNYSAALTYSQGGSRYGLAGNGAVDTQDKNDQQLSFSGSGQVDVAAAALSTTSTAAQGPVSGSISIIGSNLYFNLEDADVINAAMPTNLATSTWYKYPLSANSSLCVNAAQNPFVGGGLLSHLSFTSASLVGSSTLDGQQAMHYKYIVNMKDFAAALAAADARVPAGCRYNLSATDLQSMSINLELWHGNSIDRLITTVANPSTATSWQLTLTTSGYGKKVTITNPSVAVDASQMLNGADILGTTYKTDTISAATAGQVLAHYAQAYSQTRTKGYLSLTPATSIVPLTDPNTGMPYVITKSAPTMIGQIEYDAGRSCNGATVKPVGQTTQKASLLMLVTGRATPICTDIK